MDQMDQDVFDKLTNKKFSETIYEFIKACEEAEIKPTIRQASKWRNKKGLAWKRKYTSEKIN